MIDLSSLPAYDEEEEREEDAHHRDNPGTRSFPSAMSLLGPKYKSMVSLSDCVFGFPGEEVVHDDVSHTFTSLSSLSNSMSFTQLSGSQPHLITSPFDFPLISPFHTPLQSPYASTLSLNTDPELSSRWGSLVSLVHKVEDGQDAPDDLICGICNALYAPRILC